MSFIYIWIILAVLGWYFLNTSSGGYLLKRYCPWNEEQVRRAIWMIAVLSFVIANPVSNAVIAAAGFITYWILSKGSILSPNNENFIEDKLDQSNESFKCRIVCKPTGEDVEISTSKNNLQRCLYSSPYINQSFPPKIFFNGNDYTVDLVLTSDRYISSLKHFLLQAGFNINLINK